MLTIENLGFHVPETCPDIADLRGRAPFPANELRVLQRLYGLRRVAQSDLPIDAMLERAVGDLLDRSGVDRRDIALLIHTHTAFELRSYPNPMLDRLRRRLGLFNAVSFGMHSNNCASVLSALGVAQRFLRTRPPGSRAVIVTGDVAFTEILHTIPNTTVCGDAASACLVSADGGDAGGSRMLSLELDTYGAHAAGAWQSAEQQKAFETLYASRLAGVMTRSLHAAGLGWDDIRLVFPHNVNVISWRNVAAELRLPLNRIYLEQVPAIGHCFGADIFINWGCARDSGLIAPGNHVMLATVGIGVVFGAAVFRYGQG